MATRNQSSPFGVYVCLGLVLFVGFVQAGHSCGMSGADAQASVTSGSGTAPLTPCVSCMLQASALFLVVAMVLMGASIARVAAPLERSPRVFLTPFDLDVRPPPVR